MKLLKFYATWCNPCKQQSKLLNSLDDILIEEIDVDESSNDSLVEKYQVRGLPAMFLLDDKDEIIKEFRGLTPVINIKNAISEFNKK